jgi:hypothetical protein
MKRLTPLFLMLFGLIPALRGQALLPIQGYCSQGGVSALTQGLSSTNKLLGIIPSCTITVYQTGTLTKVTLYADAAGDPLSNPFTASALGSAAPGSWIFYAPNNVQYDVVASGGISPNTYLQPVTILAGVSAGGGGSAPPQFSVQFAANNFGAFGSDPSITINPIAHIFQAPEVYVPGSGTGKVGITDSTTMNTVWQTVQAGTTGWTFSWPMGPPNLLTSCVAVAPSGNGSIQGCILGYVPSSNIQSAVTAAGTTGPIIIPSTYTGTDTFTNPHNLRVHDLRPFNPNNLSSYAQLPGSGGTVPQTTIKATDYGALCNGVADDTVAIQAAANAAVTVIGGAGYGVKTMGSATVELPQGRCVISNTITLAGTGSIVGSANGTWLYAIDPWHGTTGDMIQITDVYVPNALPAYFPQGVNRRVQDINFEYNYNETAHTAVHVFSQYGSSATLPYPSFQNDPQAYQPQFVTISGNTVYAMDTGFLIDDCGQCVVINNQVSDVRAGFVNNGNDYDVLLTNDFFIAGTFAFTPIPTSVGPDLGIYSVSSGRYYCNSPGTGAACTGGTVTQVISSPQSLTLEDTEVEQFQRGGYIVNCLAFVMNGAGIDNAGVTALYLGQLKFAQIYYSFMDVNSPTASIIEVAGVSNAQGAGLENQDGLWITGNYIYGYSPTTGDGILFDAPALGTAARRNVYVTDNQFTNVNYGVQALGGLWYSVLRGNYGNTIGTALFNFNNSTGFVGTKLEDNTQTTGVPIYTLTSAPGLVIGYNQSPTQLSGTFYATGSGCTIGGGAIGNTCGPVTITNQFSFGDTNWRVVGCSLVGGSGPASVSAIASPTNGGTFSVAEYALTTAAVSGGTINCQVTDQ